jgi:hypothetical protein
MNTAEKRRSAASFRRLPGVTPNVSKDQEWRQQARRSYSGILAGAAGGTLLGVWAEVQEISAGQFTVEVGP